jgi:ribosome maturation factor RimP
MTRSVMTMNIRKHPVVRRIEDDVEELLDDFGYELVQIKYGGEAGGRTLSVLIDKEDGITADDCSDMSRRLSMLLDTLDPIPGSYTLIVSSPGLDRPITRDSDFDRFAGEKAAVRHRTDEGGRRTDTGLLCGVEDDSVEIEVDGETLRIPLAEIEEAHLVYDWEAEDAS